MNNEIKNEKIDGATKEQFKVMLIILTAICLIFTIVYFIRPAPSADENVQNAASQTKQKPNAAANSNAKPNDDNKQKPAPPVFNGDKKTITVNNEEVYSGSTILVNKDYPSHIDGIDLVPLMEHMSETYIVADSNVYINRSIVDSINKMFDDYHAVYGDNDIFVACAYRSYDTQLKLYNDEIASGSSSASDSVAPPGYSEHQTGYVFDLDRIDDGGIAGIAFDGTGDTKWFLDNCANYGFIVRYPSDKVATTKYEYEPWHYRYVGVPHALYMKQENLCFEEYIDKLKETSVDAPLAVSDNSGGTWAMWYVKASDGDTTEISVPKDLEYEVSGNNVDGFIVTVKTA